MLKVEANMRVESTEAYGAISVVTIDLKNRGILPRYAKIDVKFTYQGEDVYRITGREIVLREKSFVAEYLGFADSAVVKVTGPLGFRVYYFKTVYPS